jgi:hypothetical protein
MFFFFSSRMESSSTQAPEHGRSLPLFAALLFVDLNLFLAKKKGFSTRS